MTFPRVVDVIFSGLVTRIQAYKFSQAMMVIGFFLIGFFNLFTSAVQWTAGLLILFCACATFSQPQKAVRRTLQLGAAVPASQLVGYQIHNLLPYHIGPFYQCFVAIIPAAIGMLAGLAASSIKLETA